MTELQTKIMESFEKYGDHNRGNRGLPAELFYMMGGFMGHTEEAAFLTQLQQLSEQGLLECCGGGDGMKALWRKAAPKAEAPAGSGNFLAALLARFKNADAELLHGTAETAMDDFIANCGLREPRSIFQALLLAAGVGLGDVRPDTLPDSAKTLCDAVFGRMYGGDMGAVYEAVCLPTGEKDFEMLKLFCSMGGSAAGMPLLYFILSFAYTAGEPSAELAAKLEEVFGAVLLAQFFSDSPAE